MPAQIAVDCRVLVLGSMPGVASLQAQHYYAHPRNRFWPVMAALCGFDAALPYPQRLLAMQAAGGGLWDVIGRCQRPGSLDAAIVRGSERPNPLAATMAQLPQLQAVACNGASAAKAFARFIGPSLSPALAALPVLVLPSTSPANASFSLARLQQAWQPLAQWLRP